MFNDPELARDVVVVVLLVESVTVRISVHNAGRLAALAANVCTHTSDHACTSFQAHAHRCAVEQATGRFAASLLIESRHVSSNCLLHVHFWALEGAASAVATSNN